MPRLPLPALWLGLALSTVFGTEIFEGRIAVKGSEPFTYLSLTTQTRHYRLEGGLVNELWAYQGQVVKVEGEVVEQSPFAFKPSRLKIEAYTVPEGKKPSGLKRR